MSVNDSLLGSRPVRLRASHNRVRHWSGAVTRGCDILRGSGGFDGRGRRGLGDALLLLPRRVRTARRFLGRTLRLPFGCSCTRTPWSTRTPGSGRRGRGRVRHHGRQRRRLRRMVAALPRSTMHSWGGGSDRDRSCRVSDRGMGGLAGRLDGHRGAGHAPVRHERGP